MNGKIACMVRGGEAGRNVQEYTIDYARVNHKSVVFLHVVDVDSLPLRNDSLREPAREELTWLGHVKLSTARLRAEAAGVKAGAVILYGTIFEAVRNYLLASPVEMVLMGSSHPAADNYEQRLERVHQFAARLSQSTNIQVKVITPIESE
jgi:nucleotide-binding universal stress UspA family protein